MHLLTWQSFGRALVESMKGNEQHHRALNLPAFVILLVGLVQGLVGIVGGPCASGLAAADHRPTVVSQPTPT